MERHVATFAASHHLPEEDDHCVDPSASSISDTHVEKRNKTKAVLGTLAILTELTNPFCTVCNQPHFEEHRPLQKRLPLPLSQQTVGPRYLQQNSSSASYLMLGQVRQIRQFCVGPTTQQVEVPGRQFSASVRLITARREMSFGTTKVFGPDRRLTHNVNRPLGTASGQASSTRENFSELVSARRHRKDFPHRAQMD